MGPVLFVIKNMQQNRLLTEMLEVSFGAPLPGSFFQAWLSWRAVFVMLAILESVLLMALIIFVFTGLCALNARHQYKHSLKQE